MDAEVDYTPIAEYYRLLFEDWDEAIKQQAKEIDDIVRGLRDRPVRQVLDATCGVGTQALGLAALGYDVTASDSCAASIAQVQREALERGSTLAARTADLRNLVSAVGNDFDLVLSYENCLPHLLTEEDMLLGLQQCYACLKPGGLFLCTVRNYEQPDLRSKRHTQLQHFLKGGPERYVFQDWRWREGTWVYDVTQFVIAAAGATWRKLEFRVPYRAWRQDELTKLLCAVGFEQVLSGALTDRPDKVLITALRPEEGADDSGV